MRIIARLFAGVVRACAASALLGSSAGFAEPAASPFSPQPDSAIPNNAFGAMVREGEAIFRDTGTHAGAFVGNTLACSNCHLDAGRLANSAPLAQAYVRYPAYRAKTGKIDTFEERLRGCFAYSMNGREPPLGDKVLVALEAYSYFLAKGAPVGEELSGRGYPKLAKPVATPNYTRGGTVYAAKCALCHGADGAGQSAAGRTVFPALWGRQSFNWGAGMELLSNASGFIKANMPLGLGGTLSDQEAWDVATYMESHERPQDPRFTGDVAATRAKYHDTPMSLYGTKVGDALLGSGAFANGSAAAPPVP